MLIFAASVLALAIACRSNGEREDDDDDDRHDAKATAGVSAEMIARGAEIYKANCVACHGNTGKGDGPAAGVLKPPPRDHTDRTYMDTLSDDDMKKVIVMGGAVKGRPLMPSHPQLRGKDLDSLVDYVRSLSRGN